MPELSRPDFEAVTSEPPTDVEHPKLYEYTALVLGVIVALCVIAITILALRNALNDAVITGLVAIATLASGGLVRLMEPRAK
jgi:hypothetical protein